MTFKINTIKLPTRFKTKSLPILYLVSFGTLLLNIILVLLVIVRRIYVSDIRALAASIQDDSYYYLLPALNFQKYGYFTFDGIHPTYGFQPFYMIVLTALGYITPDRYNFLRSAMLFNALCFVLTAVIIFFIVDRILLYTYKPVRYCLASLSGHFFLFNIALLTLNITIKENALYGLLLSLNILMLLLIIRNNIKYNFIIKWFGMCVALMFLTRITPTCLLLAVTFGLFLYFAISHCSIKFIVPCSLVTFSWFLYALIMFGIIIPVSGSIKIQGLTMAISTGQFWIDLPSILKEVPAYMLSVFKLSLFKKSNFWDCPVNTGIIMEVYPYFLAVSIILIVFNFQVFIKNKASLATFLISIISILGTSLLPILYYYRGGEIWYYTWYIVEIPLLSTIISAIGFSFIKAPLNLSKKINLFFNCCITFCVTAILFFEISSGIYLQNFIQPLTKFIPNKQHWQDVMIQAADYARENLGLDENNTVGCWNCGALAFFSKAKTINLDGLANNDAAYKCVFGTPESFNYIRENKIEYLIDVMPDKGYFGNYFSNYEVIKTFPFPPWTYGPPNYFITRITDHKFPQIEFPSNIGFQNDIKFIRWREQPLFGKHRQRIIEFDNSKSPVRLGFNLKGAFSALNFIAGLESISNQPIINEKWKLSIAIDGRPAELFLLGNNEHTNEMTRQELEINISGAQHLLIEVIRSGEMPANTRLLIADVDFRS
jgi:hypothetical protein